METDRGGAVQRLPFPASGPSPWVRRRRRGAETAVYSCTDGFVNRRCCVTGNPDDFGVSGTPSARRSTALLRTGCLRRPAVDLSRDGGRELGGFGGATASRYRVLHRIEVSGSDERLVPHR